MNAAKILTIIQMILTYGPNAIIQIAEAMKENGDISKEDIEKLFIDKDPEEYFE